MGNSVIDPSSKHFLRCSHILPCCTLTGSKPKVRAVAVAAAKNPQSLVSICLHVSAILIKGLPFVSNKLNNRHCVLLFTYVQRESNISAPERRNHSDFLECGLSEHLVLSSLASFVLAVCFSTLRCVGITCLVVLEHSSHAC